MHCEVVGGGIYAAVSLLPPLYAPLRLSVPVGVVGAFTLLAVLVRWTVLRGWLRLGVRLFGRSRDRKLAVLGRYFPHLRGAGSCRSLLACGVRYSVPVVNLVGFYEQERCVKQQFYIRLLGALL